MLTRDISNGGSLRSSNESVLMAPLDSRYTQVGFNLVSVQACVYVKENCQYLGEFDHVGVKDINFDGFAGDVLVLVQDMD